MVTIDLEGAQALLDLLQRVRGGHPASESELEEVMAANAFFIDFYSQWEGGDRETIKEAICCFDQPEQVPPGMLPTRMAEGFRQAADEMDLMRGRMSWLGGIDASGIADQVLAFLPADTPLDSVIHITVDLFNNAFVHQREMGVSLLKGATDRSTFEEAVAHELHHVCFRFWAERDRTRQQLKQERSGRAVAVLHVENLLSEGMANCYCSPRYVFETRPDRLPGDAYVSRLARLRREEAQLFSKAEAILASSLESGADYGICLEAYNSLALDMEDFQLPAAHYLGMLVPPMVVISLRLDEFDDIVEGGRHHDTPWDSPCRFVSLGSGRFLPES